MAQKAKASSSTSSSSTSSTSTTSTIDLETLSDSELETLCTDLGFSLITTKEDGTPLQLSHADYVEAARQCLSIQDQMEEVLAEHPELMEEYKEERDRMMAAQLEERERLLKEKDRLEQELKVAQEEVASSTTGTRKPNAAFVGNDQVVAAEDHDDTDDDITITTNTVQEEDKNDMESDSSSSSSTESSVMDKAPSSMNTTTTTTTTTTTVPISSMEVDEDDLVNQVISESTSLSASSSLSSSTSWISQESMELFLSRVGNVWNRVIPPSLQVWMEQHIISKAQQEQGKVILAKVLVRLYQDGKTAWNVLKRQGMALFHTIVDRVKEYASKQKRKRMEAKQESEGSHRNAVDEKDQHDPL